MNGTGDRTEDPTFRGLEGHPDQTNFGTSEPGNRHCSALDALPEKLLRRCGASIGLLCTSPLCRGRHKVDKSCRASPRFLSVPSSNACRRSEVIFPPCVNHVRNSNSRVAISWAHSAKHTQIARPVMQRAITDHFNHHRPESFE